MERIPAFNTILYIIVLGVLGTVITYGKKKKSIQTGKEEVKSFRFGDAIILHIENPQVYLKKKKIRAKNEFSKIAGPKKKKINMQISVAPFFKDLNIFV